MRSRHLSSCGDIVAAHIEVVTATQALLPAPCPDCLWWQTTQGPTQGRTRRLEWMGALEEAWGSVGLVSVEDGETVASIQFAPIRSLARPHSLALGQPPEDAVLLFCLRGRVGRPNVGTQRLLHAAMSHLRRRGVREVYGYARPLDTHSLSGVRNLFGLEFLEANGFSVARAIDHAYLMRAELGGLIPTLEEARSSIRKRLGTRAHPSPATFGRS